MSDNGNSIASSTWLTWYSSGVRTSYTVALAASDWLAVGDGAEVSPVSLLLCPGFALANMIPATLMTAIMDSVRINFLLISLPYFY